MTDENTPEESKLKHHAKAAAAELGKSVFATADKLGAQAKDQFEKLSPKAKELSGKARKHPKFKLFAGLAAAVVLALVVVSALPGGPTAADIEQAMRDKCCLPTQKQARKHSSAGSAARDNSKEKLAQEEKNIAEMNIDVEIINKEEVEEGTWKVKAYTTISAEGVEEQGVDRVYTMREGKKGWRML